jgi:hypothetical protein
MHMFRAKVLNYTTFLKTCLLKCLWITLFYNQFPLSMYGLYINYIHILGWIISISFIFVMNLYICYIIKSAYKFTYFLVMVLEQIMSCKKFLAYCHLYAFPKIFSHFYVLYLDLYLLFFQSKKLSSSTRYKKLGRGYSEDQGITFWTY